MSLRFEQRVAIILRCCGQSMQLGGNLSLREAGATCTLLGYECTKCYQRVAVADAWPDPGLSVFENDSVE